MKFRLKWICVVMIMLATKVICFGQTSASDRFIMYAQEIFDADTCCWRLLAADEAPREDLNKSGNTDLLVSPNPASDQIKIQSVSRISELRLFDSTSKLVFSVFPNQNTYTLVVENLNPGIYLLNIIQGKVVHATKIVVTR